MIENYFLQLSAIDTALKIISVPWKDYIVEEICSAIDFYTDSALLNCLEE
jgi:hypothetical protein